MRIGELAKSAGVNVETVRYYERRGLLPPPARTQAGYRRYQPASVARLRFIRRARALGFTLHEIDELLTLRARPGAACDVVDVKAREKIALLRRKIQEMTAIEQSLTRLAGACDGRSPIGDCPILHELEAVDLT